MDVEHKLFYTQLYILVNTIFSVCGISHMCSLKISFNLCLVVCGTDILLQNKIYNEYIVISKSSWGRIYN